MRRQRVYLHFFCAIWLVLLPNIRAVYAQSSPTKASSAQQPKAQQPKAQAAAGSELQKMFADALKAAQSGKFSEALQGFTAILQRTPNDASALSNRAFIYFQMNNAAAAIEDANKALKLSPKNYATYLIRGAANLNLQRLDAAIADLSVYIKAVPGETIGFYNRATAYIQKRDYQSAVQDLDACIRLQPKNAGLYLQRGSVKNQLGDMTLEQDFQTAIRLDSSYLDAYHNLAQHYVFQQRYAEAETVLRKKIALRPAEMLNYTILGYVATQNNKLLDAIAAFSSVLRQDSNDVKTLGYRAFAYFRARKYAESLQDCKRYFSLNRGDVLLTRSQNVLVSANSTLEQGITTLGHGQMYLLRGVVRQHLRDTDWHNDIRKAFLLGTQPVTLFNLLDSTDDVNMFLAGPQYKTLRISEWVFPESYQLYPRNQDDSALVPLRGSITRPGYDSVYVRAYKNNQLFRRFAEPLLYNTTTQASFTLQVRIHAEKSIYRFELGVKNKTQDTTLMTRDSIVCGDAFIVSGQSNVVFGDEYTVKEPAYLRTFAPAYSEGFWTIPPRRQNTLANVLGERLLQASSVPIAILNGGINGATIEQHLPQTPRTAQNTLFGRMNAFATAARLANHAKAIIWYQGEANLAGGYAQKFDTLATAWKQDFPDLKKIYCVQIRPSECGQPTQDVLREIQRGITQKRSDVEVLASAAAPAHDGCHYGNDGYITLGTQIARLIARDFYKSADTLGISSPNLLKAAWTSSKRDEIALTFATNDSLICGADTSVAGRIRTLANDAFLLDGKPARAVSVRSVEKNIVLLKFATPIAMQRISYVPEKCYAGSPDAPCVVYEGPWITTRRGVGALTFTNVPIQTAP